MKSAVRVTPNFLVIGAQKSGTTSLCALLGQHPEVFMTDPKEPHFFAKDEVYANGWEWYLSLFRNAGGAKALGEGSTGYTLHAAYPMASARVAKHLPHAKLIYIVRHPVERIESAWLQRKSDGSPVWSMAKTLKQYPHMLDASRYWRQISYYRRYFSDDRIHVVFFEDFRQQPSVVLKDCFSFLGVDPAFAVERPFKAYNASQGKRVENTLSVWARHNPKIRSVGQLFPKELRQWVRGLAGEELQERPAWDTRTLEWVLYEVGSDTAQFLHAFGKAGDYWDFHVW